MEKFSLADIKAAVGDKPGFLEGNGIIILILFFLIFAGGAGGGLFGGGGSAVASQISNDFLYNNLNNSLNLGFTQAANQSFAIQKDICQLGHNMDMCCCTTNRNIDAVRYENAKNTCDIITAGNANTQRIVDTITQNEIQTLRDQLQSAQLTLGQAAQSQYLVAQLKPSPVPAYTVCSPYTAATGFYNGCGCA